MKRLKSIVEKTLEIFSMILVVGLFLFLALIMLIGIILMREMLLEVIARSWV